MQREGRPDGLRRDVPGASGFRAQHAEGNAKNSLEPRYRDKSPEALSSDCLSSCEASKAQALDAAMHYYQKVLPERIAAEKQTLAQLTGWSLHDIDAMPGARHFSGLPRAGTPEANVAAPAQTWWQRLFAK
jgi:hypothetical protein